MSSVTLLLLIFIVAALYASVGHGGASGYLAVLALAGYAPAQMSTSALVLNVLVAGLACMAFWRAGHFSWRLTWPFLVTSVPCALVGGWLDVSSHAYQWLFAVVLLVAAVRLCLPVLPAAQAVASTGPRRSAAWPIGAGIGLISGIVGIGGGIFLSPLLVLCRWTSAKEAAAASACFIVVNSAAGLAGRLAGGRCEVGLLLPLVGVAFVGGWLGSRLGAGYFSNPALCRILATVLAVAAMKGLVT
jgi:hypothetical protein